MISDDDAALACALTGADERDDGTVVHNKMSPDDDIARSNEIKGNLVQWTTGDGKRFLPSGSTCQRLTPGCYDIKYNDSVGLFFEKITITTEGLLRFPQTNSNKVVTEIQTFWEREQRFIDYNLCYKRGIILWGPAGSGKSSTIKLINADVIQRGGIVVKFSSPGLFVEGMRIFRYVQPDTPVVVLMEDIDSILDQYNESEVLNILDGVEQLNKLVYLATTNYPERLGARIINRPSRFDKRFRIGHPNSESRRMYFEYLFTSGSGEETVSVEIDRWVEDTEGFSIAHLKELFVAVIILGDDYDAAITTLSSMLETTPDSEDDEHKKPLGFAGHLAKQRCVTSDEDD